MKTLSIQTLPIKIHVVKVGNRQMTKNIFRQIPLKNSNEFIHHILGLDLIGMSANPASTLIGWVNYRPENPYEDSYIDEQNLFECHLEFYNATGFRDYSIDGYEYQKDDFKRAYDTFFKGMDKKPGILFPKPRLQYHYQKPKTYTGSIYYKHPISVLMKCNIEDTIFRGYIPVEYLNSFKIPQIYIAT